MRPRKTKNRFSNNLVGCVLRRRRRGNQARHNNHLLLQFKKTPSKRHKRLEGVFVAQTECIFRCPARFVDRVAGVCLLVVQNVGKMRCRFSAHLVVVLADRRGSHTRKFLAYLHSRRFVAAFDCAVVLFEPTILKERLGKQKSKQEQTEIST